MKKETKNKKPKTVKELFDFLQEMQEKCNEDSLKNFDYTLKLIDYGLKCMETGDTKRYNLVEKMLEYVNIIEKQNQILRARINKKQWEIISKAMEKANKELWGDVPEVDMSDIQDEQLGMDDKMLKMAGLTREQWKSFKEACKNDFGEKSKTNE